MPQNRPIKIEGIEPNGTLRLSDKGNTIVQRGDTVTWSIHPGSKVQKINNIVKSGGVEVFSEKPAPIGSSGHWRGTISPTIQDGSEQKYDIHYTPEGSTEVVVFDPKIIVNSR
ncbi:hypothetical protein [Aquiflexum gelatinilyticum]|uniref:hypothetical protein n=1 Tax=Aquiflexum gelatinilyticum TaxID=2961943 RepID=UPI002168A157|nr:hypothetical protein [Aquiflexum gelatinilyticum]MCS4433004.1 hypothetical protein [Aquiflexum gelatinilyticum]